MEKNRENLNNPNQDLPQDFKLNFGARHTIKYK